MKTVLVLFGCVAIAAGFGINWDHFLNNGGGGDAYLNRLDNGDYGNRLAYQNYQDMMLQGLGIRDIQGNDLNVVRDTTGRGRIGQTDLRNAIRNDKDIMLKQKFILDVLRNVYTTVGMDNTGDTHNFVEGDTNYIHHDRVLKFFRMCRDTTTKHCLLQRGQVFNILDDTHCRQTVALFNLFYCSKDFDVFRRNVLWARNCVNEEMFVQALTTAIFHRNDLIGIKIPAHYEILPHKFHTSMTLANARNMRMENVKDNVVIVRADYTNDILTMNDEARLAYLTEDVGWNLFHFYMFTAYPFWLGGEDLGLYRHHRGERYLYIIQQLLARYYMERLSHGMGHIDDISFHVPIRTGYNPQMSHTNGLGYSIRRNYYDVYTTGDFYLLARVRDFERRIRDAIDQGYCVAKDGTRIDLRGDNGIDVLGNIIQSNGDSVNNQFYGGLIRLMRKLLGGGQMRYTDRNHMLPNVMDSCETAFRDPVTYQIYKRVWKLFYQYKNTLNPYKPQDLLLNGVRIENLYTTKLVTYFDHFDVDITSAVDHGMRTDDRVVLARHMRLNHKPFTINMDVVSDRAEKVVIRIFLGPKYNHLGKIIHLNDNRENFMELDKFVYDLPVGRVAIKRESREFIYNVRDRTTYLDLYKRILLNKDLNTLMDLNIVESHCGFPDRLLLPRGWTGGMTMQMFVIITQATNFGKHDNVVNRCGRNINWFHVDDFVMGFPFDRRIDEGNFYTTNMLFKDVLIFHEGYDGYGPNGMMKRSGDIMQNSGIYNAGVTHTVHTIGQV